MEWIEQTAVQDEDLKDTLMFMLEDFRHQRNLLLKIERRLREKMRGEKHITQLNLATSVPGIGIITGTRFLLEIGDLNRFENFDRLNNMIGFYPGSHDSGDTVRSSRADKFDRRQLP